MMRRLVRFAAVAGLVGLLAAPTVRAAIPSKPWVPQAATYGEASDLNLPVVASDGTVLRADVYYPTDLRTGAAAAGPFPVLLQQTPYGKEAFGGASSLTATDIPYLVDRGYIVVISDVRGTGDSGGTFGLFDPIQQSDGATLARWASKLPHSDGKVGLFGESYMGINQFLTVAGLGGGSPVKAMFPIISGHDIFSDSVVQGGLVDAEFSSFYVALVAGLNAANPLLERLAEGKSPDLANLLAVEASHNEALLSYDLPVVANTVSGGSLAFDGPYWRVRSPSSYLQQVVSDHIPAFLVGGWNDLFQAGEPLNYVALQNLYSDLPATAPMSPNQKATPRYQLMMGPWQHVTTGTGVNLAAIELEWFDTWLLGENTPLAHTTTPLHLEQEQSGNWIDSATWPLRAARATAFYFGAGRSGSGALSTNDGTLTTSSPAASSGADPVLWTPVSSPCSIQTDQWSAGLLALGAQSLGTTFPCDTNDVTLGSGPGALTYTTSPFAQPQVLGGPIDATVYTTSTTSDTELVGTIEEVSPSGASIPLTSGALLGSLRAVDPSMSWAGSNGKLLFPYHPLTQASEKSVVPGALTRYDIQIFPTFAEIPAGWRIRLTLTTSDTPHLMPTVPAAARLRGGVYLVQRHAGAASYLNLPLAPLSSFATPCGALCAPQGP